MKKFTLTTLSTAVLMSTIAAPTFAADYDQSEPDIFVGGSLVYSKLENLSLGDENIEELGDADEFNDDKASWKAFAGVWANDWVGVETQYLDLGEFKEGSFSVDPSGFTAAVLLGLPAGDHSRVYVKGGQFWWDADVKGPLGYNDKRSGSTLFYGVGASFELLPNLNLRAEYERADFDEDNVEADIDFASVGLGFMF